MKTYAMSDIHGRMDVFSEMLALVALDDPEVRLVLLGDYIDHGFRHPEVYAALKALKDAHPGNVIVLKGNVDVAFLEENGVALSGELRRWVSHLPVHFETERQIFVHAGIDEEAGDLWRWASEDWYFLGKYPAATGPFYKDVIAGHVGTTTFCGEPRVWWDGEAHYYIDGSVESTGTIPLLAYDDATGRYTTFERTSTGAWAEVPVTAG